MVMGRFKSLFAVTKPIFKKAYAKQLLRSLSATLNNVGALLYECGHNEEALIYLEEAANIRATVIESSSYEIYDFSRYQEVKRKERELHELLLTKKNKDSMAIDMFSTKRGHCDIKCFSEAILIDHGQYREDSFLSVVTMYNMALVLRVHGFSKLAMRVLELSLSEIDTSVWPLLSTAILVNIGKIHYEDGREEKSMEIFSNAVRLLEHHIKEHSSYQANEHIKRCMGATISTIAMIFLRKGLFENALDLCENTNELLSSVLIEDHKDFLVSMYNMSLVLYLKRDYEEALEKCQMVLSLVMNKKNHHMIAAAAFHTIGLIQTELGDLYQAMESLSKSLKMKKKVLGCKHDDVAEVYYDLGCVMYNLGQYRKALEFLEISLRTKRNNTADKNQEIVMITCKIGNIHHIMGDLDMALVMYEQALCVAKDKFGQNNHLVGGILSTIGVICLENGNTERANKNFYHVSNILLMGDDAFLNIDFPSINMKLCFGLESYPASPAA